jgi:Icc protein
MLVFGQLSDVHLNGGPERAGRIATALGYLGRISPPLDAVLLSGDIADHGQAAEYAEAREALAALPCPVLTLPGNHDDRAAFRSVLLGQDAGAAGDGSGEAGPVNQLRDVGGARFALCDSTIPGQNPGYLDDETIAWLDGALAQAPDRPAFVCLHHPPAPLHMPILDPIALTGPGRLAAVIERHPQVVATLCGHAHVPAATMFAGRPLLVTPGVASTAVLPFEPDAADIVDEQAPVLVAVHLLDGTRLTTHYRLAR